MYAIVESGGKQLGVEPGQRVRVEKLPAEVGAEVVFDRVLLVADSDPQQVVVGRPQVEQARVVGKVTAQGRGKKIYVVKFHSKNNYRRRTGHRQPFTEVWIDRIEWAGKVARATEQQKAAPAATASPESATPAAAATPATGEAKE